ncbi:MAG: flavodoxin [Selenomonadaceae bacterium]|nr:flavodoxin [Selenomonadaceae bacterium]
MNITRRNFFKMAIGAGLLSSFGKAHAATDEKILVVYFSRTGDEYRVGNISTGNTSIVAEYIAEKTGGDTFEIKPVKDYPFDYNECTQIASQEKATKARPEFVGSVDVSPYDIIFVGYPIWWGDMPQIIYTFLESYEFGGKKIIPFCTHGGSGLSGTEQRFAIACPSAQILKGFAVLGTTAQKNRSETESIVVDNLNRLGLL